MTEKDSNILNKPYVLSHELFAFYADSVGKVLNHTKELVLLLDWSESIEACDKMARNLRDRHTMRDMDAFRREVKILIECNAVTE